MLGQQHLCMDIELIHRALAATSLEIQTRKWLRAQEEVMVARAPGRLDVMGGIADYSGSLVLQLPLAEACHVAVQRLQPAPGIQYFGSSSAATVVMHSACFECRPNSKAHASAARSRHARYTNPAPLHDVCKTGAVHEPRLAPLLAEAPIWPRRQSADAAHCVAGRRIQRPGALL